MMNIVLVKMFRLDDYEFEEEVLFPLNRLYFQKKAMIKSFYDEILMLNDP